MRQPQEESSLVLAAALVSGVLAFVVFGALVQLSGC